MLHMVLEAQSIGPGVSCWSLLLTSSQCCRSPAAILALFVLRVSGKNTRYSCDGGNSVPLPD